MRKKSQIHIGAVRSRKSIKVVVELSDCVVIFVSDSLVESAPLSVDN